MLFIKQKGIFNTYKGRLRKEIQQYCKEKAIPETEFHFLSIHKWEDVYNKIVTNFKEKEWISKNGLHWLNISCSYSKEICYSLRDYECWEWSLKLPDIVGKDDFIYLVLEENGQINKFWVTEGKPKVIAELIYEECFDSDYYIVDKKFQWMISRNHHEYVHFVGEDAHFNFATIQGEK